MMHVNGRVCVCLCNVEDGVGDRVVRNDEADVTCHRVATHRTTLWACMANAYASHRMRLCCVRFLVRGSVT